jgi:hypothetical protein
MNSSKKTIVKKGTLRLALSEGQKEHLSEEFTKHINSLTPKGYRYKRTIKYEDQFGEVDNIPICKVEFEVEFEEN